MGTDGISGAVNLFVLLSEMDAVGKWLCKDIEIGMGDGKPKDAMYICRRENGPPN